MRIASLSTASLFFFISTTNAFAYLDPGTGSILLQGIIGAIASGLFIMKMYWAKFKGMIWLSPTSSENDNQKS